MTIKTGKVRENMLPPGVRRWPFDDATIPEPPRYSAGIAELRNEVLAKCAGNNRQSATFEIFDNPEYRAFPYAVVMTIEGTKYFAAFE